MTIFPTIRVKAFLNIYLLNLPRNVTLAEGNETLAFGHYKIPHSSPKTIVPITLDNPTLFLDEKKFVVSDDEMKQSDNEEKFELKPTVWFDFPSHFRGKIKQQKVVRVNFFFILLDSIGD